MTDNSKIRGIIENQDVKGLLALDNGEKEDFLFALIYDCLTEKSLAEMNETQKTLFLASKLEDVCQADSLPSLSEDEEIFLALPDIKISLERLGAVKTAGLLEEFMSLVPAGTVPEWEWFFEAERKDIIAQIDSGICNYPDGTMINLYVAYISDPQNAEQLLADLNNGKGNER